MKKLKRICAKIKDGFKTLFVSNKKAENQFMYDSTSYALNFDGMTDKDRDKDDDGRASQTFAARVAQPYAPENRKSEKQVSKEAK